MSLYFNNWAVRNIDELINSYDAAAFASPKRSTVPLLALLKDADGVWAEVLHSLGMTDDAEVRAEYTVVPQRGKGKASHTDLMLIEATRRRAIEAKWTEPRYPIVSNWRTRGRDPLNRDEVVAGWLELLRPYCVEKPEQNAVETVVYQLLHRAASAASNCSSPGLAYLVFSQSQAHPAGSTDQLSRDLRGLRQALGLTGNFQTWVIHAELQPTPAFSRIKDLPKGELETSERVKAALLEEKLFDFGKPRIEVVN